MSKRRKMVEIFSALVEAEQSSLGPCSGGHSKLPTEDEQWQKLTKTEFAKRYGSEKARDRSK